MNMKKDEKDALSISIRLVYMLMSCSKEAQGRSQLYELGVTDKTLNRYIEMGYFKTKKPSEEIVLNKRPIKEVVVISAKGKKLLSQLSKRLNELDI